MKHPRIATTQPQLRAIALAVMLMAPLAATAQPAAVNSSVKASSAKAAAADDAKAAAKDNAQAVPGNAGTTLPVTQTPRSAAESAITSGRTTSRDAAIENATSGTAAGKTTPGIKDAGQKPGSDQGFASKPGAVSVSGTGNPAKDQSGSTGGSGPTGIAGQGKGAISGDFMGDKKRSGSDQLRNVEKVFTSSNGEIITTYDDGSFDIEGSKGKESYDKDHKCTSKACASIPGGEQRMSKAEFEAFLKAHPAVAAQLQQAKAGGSGETDPARGDGDSFSRGTAVTPPSASQRQRDLVGNPGQAQTGGTVGGNRNLDPGGNAGTINPSPDSTTTSGNRQQDPGDFIGSAPTRDFPSCDRDGRTPQLSDDCPKQ